MISSIRGKMLMKSLHLIRYTIDCLRTATSVYERVYVVCMWQRILNALTRSASNDINKSEIIPKISA